MSWFEFYCAVDGLRESRKHDFNVMRNHASLTMMPHIERKDQSKIRPDRLFPFEDERIEPQRLSKDEAIDWVQYFNRRLINREELN
jgi:hypothetical protein